MTKLVIDSGVAIKWFAAELYSAEAERIFDEYLAGNLFFLAPNFIYAEFGNLAVKESGLLYEDQLPLAERIR